MILNLSLNTRMIWIILIKTYKCTPTPSPNNNNSTNKINKIKSEILIVSDDMIADMLNNKKRNPIVTELFIRGRK